jgi:seryl-tRNA synthetase
MCHERTCSHGVRRLTGVLPQAKQDADHLLKEKADLEKEKKQVEEEAVEKEKARDKKCKTIGNYVHESVPLHDNEVGKHGDHAFGLPDTDGKARTSTKLSSNGPPKASRSRRETVCRTTKS